MTTPLHKRFEPPRDVQSRRFHDETVVLDLVRGEYFSLDEVGSKVWDSLVAGSSVPEVVAALEKEFDADAERIEADVVALVDDLVARRLLVERP